VGGADVPTTLLFEPQAALERAVELALKQQLEPVPYRDAECSRTYDGQPPANMGQFYVAVWYTGERQPVFDRQALGMQFGVNVTVTRKAQLPRDRWVEHRDEIAVRLNAIAALLGKDGQFREICNAAMKLAGFEHGVGTPIGFREGLKFSHYGPIEEKGADWFSGHPGKHECGFAQTVYFGEVLRVQNVATAS
jgi:hypothetical protein